jgi:hypothetical protein
MANIQVWTASTPSVEPDEYDDVLFWEVLPGGALRMDWVDGSSKLIAAGVWRKVEIT